MPSLEPTHVMSCESLTLLCDYEMRCYVLFDGFLIIYLSSLLF